MSTYLVEIGQDNYIVNFWEIENHLQKVDLHHWLLQRVH